MALLILKSSSRMSSSMQHKAARLPAELTDRVIDHLHSDKLALAKCSLVCKDWLPASRYHFFQTHIRLTNRNIHSFVELLNSPASTFLQHELNVDIFPGPYFDSHNPQSVNCIFDTMSHHLLRLDIRSLRFMCVEWDIKDEKLQEIFECFATVSSLELLAVKFSAPNQFIKFITSFLSLESWSLCGVTFETYDFTQITPFTPSSLLRLVDLTLEYLDPSFIWFLLAVRFPPLECLYMSNIVREDVGAVLAVLQPSGPSLRRLHLGFSDRGTFISERWCSSSSFYFIIQMLVVFSI